MYLGMNWDTYPGVSLSVGVGGESEKVGGGHSLAPIFFYLFIYLFFFIFIFFYF